MIYRQELEMFHLPCLNIVSSMHSTLEFILTIRYNELPTKWLGISIRCISASNSHEDLSKRSFDIIILKKIRSSLYLFSFLNSYFMPSGLWIVLSECRTVQRLRHSKATATTVFHMSKATAKMVSHMELHTFHMVQSTRVQSLGRHTFYYL